MSVNTYNLMGFLNRNEILSELKVTFILSNCNYNLNDLLNGRY